MLSVKQEVEKIIQENPFIEDLIVQNLINLSSYARKIKPEIETRLSKTVSVGSIVMSLKRLVPSLQSRGYLDVSEFIEDLMVRSGLTVMTFENLDSLFTNLKIILEKYSHRKDVFVNFSRGSVETTIVCNQSISQEIRQILKKEKLIHSFDEVGSITLKLSSKTVNINGVYYSLFKIIANKGINMIEIISTYRELTIIVAEDKLDKAFVALKECL